jgi:hypothetical protein
MAVSTVIFLLITISIMPSITHATITSVSEEKQAISPPFDLSNPPPGTMTMDQLIAIASTSKDFGSAEYEPLFDTIDNFALHSDVRASMSQEEWYELLCLPGYFTPKQTSLSEIAEQEQTTRTNPQPVQAIISIDAEMWAYYCSITYGPYFWESCCAWANNILEAGDDILEMGYGIDFRSHTYVYWDTPDNLNYFQLLDIVKSIDPTTIGADVMIVMSGQDSGNIAGAVEPVYRLHGIMNVLCSPNANLFQHEVSHMYWCPDHPYVPKECNMCDCFGTRTYCSSCHSTLNTNRFRFD